MHVLMEAQELKALIKEGLREVLREERLLLCNALMPYVSDAGQQELEDTFGSPSDYADEEFTDLTAWVQQFIPLVPEAMSTKIKQEPS